MPENAEMLRDLHSEESIKPTDVVFEEKLRKRGQRAIRVLRGIKLGEKKGVAKPLFSLCFLRETYKNGLFLQSRSFFREKRGLKKRAQILVPKNGPFIEPFMVATDSLGTKNVGSRSVMSHIYIYIYMLWCYYLGQVWPFEVLLSGPSLLFTKHCLSKNTIKIGVSALLFLKKKLRAQI